MKRRRPSRVKTVSRSRPSNRRLRLEPLESRHLLATFDLAFADIEIFGVDANDESGIRVSDAGDVNGDGFDDFLIGARYGDGPTNNRNAAGESYLVFGRADLSETTTIDLANLGDDGVTFFGATAFDYSGRSLSSAGDVNGDGFDDLLIGAVEADGANNIELQSGESYIVFGKEDWSTTQTIDFANLGTNGVTLSGTDAYDLSGRAVSNAGDINGDGFDDILIGAHYGDGANNSRPGSGESIVVFGREQWTPTLDLGNLGDAGVTIYGADQGDDSGIAVSGAGDVNGDGFDDLLIGARYADAVNNAVNAAGESYIVFGKSDWSNTLTLDLATLGTAGVTIIGDDANDYSGLALSNAGDVNGDGFDDVLIGAVGGDYSDESRFEAGESYLIFGKSNFAATLNLSNLGANGVIFFGNDETDNSGVDISGAGDVNGDGFDDLIIGARYGDGFDNLEPDAGESYLIFGKSNWPQEFFLGNVGDAGVVFFGAEPADYSGFALSSAGDLDGDGFDDLIIGSVGGDAVYNSKLSAGDSYIIFGNDDFTSSVTELGTAASETLTGSSRDDIMVGHRGSDLLLGLGGDDVMRGGQGNDIFAVTDLDFDRIVGGSGIDTIRLDGSNFVFNLLLRRDNRTQGIERIDIRGTGSNTLTLDVLEVLNLSDESNTLVVLRDTNDTVNRGSGWAQGPDEEIGGDIFEVFTQGVAILKIQSTVADISLTKTASANTVLAGNSFSYTLSVINEGPSAATGVVISDSLPAGLAFDSTNSSSLCSAVGRLVTCNMTSIQANGSKQAQIAVKTASSVPHGSQISNTATVVSNESDPTPADRSSTIVVTVNRLAELSVTETASVDPATAGGPLNFTMLIENDGPSDASNVVVTSTLPAELTFSATTSTGNCSAVGQLVTCNVGTIAAGMNTAPRIGTVVNSSVAVGTDITNTVDLAASETDPTPGDHTATVTVTTIRQTNLRVAKSASQNPVIAGEAFHYTVEALNLGPSDATGVVVTDTLPDGLLFDSANSSNSCAAAGQLVNCPIGDMTANANVFLTIAVTVSAALTRGTVLSNTANISGNELDPNPTDQSSSVEVTVNVTPDPLPWQNVVTRRDVNKDRFVTPIDALVIINELNSPNFSAPNGQLPVPPAPGNHPFFDVNGDNFVTTNDVLIIVNFLNENNGEGEGFAREPEIATDSLMAEIIVEPSSTTATEPARRQQLPISATRLASAIPILQESQRRVVADPVSADLVLATERFDPSAMDLDELLENLTGLCTNNPKSVL